MALGTTNIGLNAVKDLLGEDQTKLFHVGTSPLINKWSRFKPYRWAGFGNYPNWGDVNFGLNIPTNWDYLQPRGGSMGGTPDEPVRLGDFRGYEHNKALTPPPVRSTSPPSGTYYPTTSAYPPAGKPKEDNWLCYINVSHDSVRITPSDLYVAGTSISQYYFGVRLNKSGSGTYYYKTRQVALTDNSAVNFDLTITNLVNIAYTDFPSTGNDVGTWNYMIFISSSKTATEAWTTTAPSGIIELPTDADIPSLVSSGTFSVAHYIVCGISSASLPYTATSATSGYVATVVSTSSSNPFTITKRV